MKTDPRGSSGFGSSRNRASSQMEPRHNTLKDSRYQINRGSRENVGTITSRSESQHIRSSDGLSASALGKDDIIK